MINEIEKIYFDEEGAFVWRTSAFGYAIKWRLKSADLKTRGKSNTKGRKAGKLTKAEKGKLNEIVYSHPERFKKGENAVRVNDKIVYIEYEDYEHFYKVIDIRRGK